MSIKEFTGVMGEERQAPVQSNEANTIPWRVHVRAWQVYAALGHGDQSAERIAERGGFGWMELACLLAECDPWSCTWQPLTDREQSRLAGLREHDAEAIR